LLFDRQIISNIVESLKMESSDTGVKPVFNGFRKQALMERVVYPGLFALQ
jgi:hypothetical protein